MRPGFLSITGNYLLTGLSAGATHTLNVGSYSQTCAESTFSFPSVCDTGTFNGTQTVLVPFTLGQAFTFSQSATSSASGWRKYPSLCKRSGYRPDCFVRRRPGESPLCSASGCGCSGTWFFGSPQRWLAGSGNLRQEKAGIHRDAKLGIRLSLRDSLLLPSLL